MVRKLDFRRSGGRTIVVVQHSAETFATRNHACSAPIKAGGDQAIADPLVIPFMVIVLHKLMDSSAE